MLYTSDVRVINTTPSTLSGGAVSPAVSLNALPDDIYRLVLSELADASPLSVVNVAQVSRALRIAALPLVYRAITLTRGSEESKERVKYEAILEKFQQDENGEFTRHVRSLRVKTEVPSEDLIAILSKISRLGNLKNLKCVLTII